MIVGICYVNMFITSMSIGNEVTGLAYQPQLPIPTVVQKGVYCTCGSMLWGRGACLGFACIVTTKLFQW